MTTEEGLLAAVLESPDDDLPRLVYADLLDEVGRTEEALFIRRQVHLWTGLVCERDNKPIGPKSSRWWREKCRCANCTTARRVEESLKKRKDYGEKYLRLAQPAWWRAEVGGSMLPDVRRDVAHLQPRLTLRWRRGFVHAVECNETFARHGLRQMLDDQPLGEVTIYRNPNTVPNVTINYTRRLAIKRVSSSWQVRIEGPHGAETVYKDTRDMTVRFVDALAYSLFPYRVL